MPDFSRWKIALSYVLDVPLARKESPENGTMRLFLSRGQLKLTTANTVYSYGIHYRSFREAFHRLGVLRDQTVRDVLVLGWAMGSLAELLRHHAPVRTVTAVEHDRELVAWWQEWMPSDYPFRVEPVVDDARHFCMLPGQAGRFDLVCVDLFTDQVTHEDFIQPPFLEALTGLCRPGGRVLFSKLQVSASDRSQNRTLEENLARAGHAFQVVHTPGNAVYTWHRTEQAAGPRDNLPESQ